MAIAGVAFLFVAIGGRISERLSVERIRPLPAGIFGGLLVVCGAAIFIWQNIPTDTELAVSKETLKQVFSDEFVEPAPAKEIRDAVIARSAATVRQSLRQKAGYFVQRQLPISLRAEGEAVETTATCNWGTCNGVQYNISGKTVQITP